MWTGAQLICGWLLWIVNTAFTKKDYSCLVVKALTAKLKLNSRCTPSYMCQNELDSNTKHFLEYRLRLRNCCSHLSPIFIKPYKIRFLVRSCEIFFWAASMKICFKWLDKLNIQIIFIYAVKVCKHLYKWYSKLIVSQIEVFVSRWK